MSESPFKPEGERPPTRSDIANAKLSAWYWWSSGFLAGSAFVCLIWAILS